MNRLILIGNGFDLAHGMKTSYRNFIDWYVNSCFRSSVNNFEDGLMNIQRNQAMKYDPEGDYSIQECQKYIDSRGFNAYSYSSPQFCWTFKHPFMSHLITACLECGWVNIEQEYYVYLKMAKDSPQRAKDIKSLNTSFGNLINKLQEYLSQLALPDMHPDYKGIVNEKIRPEDIAARNGVGSPYPERIFILNFNYTNLAEKYSTSYSNLSYVQIHGKLNDQSNPIIFGFGDEMDGNFSSIENLGDNEFMRYFKSFGYHKTRNYQSLIRFLESDSFHVYTLGMSCGVSDRTMLNMIFEHQNCNSIKIFYYKNGDKNNFTDLTMDISRHFRKKGLARKLIVNFEDSQPMPQL